MNTTYLKRDANSRAVINTDYDSYKSFRHDEKKNRELQQTVKRVDSLQSDVNEIKQMLQTIIIGLNKNG